MPAGTDADRRLADNPPLHQAVSYMRNGVARAASPSYDSPPRRTVADVIPLDEFERKAAREHERVVQSLLDLADRIEAMPEANLREALPIAAGGVDELVRRLALLQPHDPGRLRPHQQHRSVR